MSGRRQDGGGAAGGAKERLTHPRGSTRRVAVLLEQLVELDLRHATPPAQRLLVSDGRGAAQAEDRVHGAVAAAADNGGGACVGEYLEVGG
eukprot:754977-Hanusia_phi.AAC.1